MAEESTIITKEIGHLKGHSDWVTCIETGHPQKENEDTQVLITASRDKSILIWKFNPDSKINTDFGEPVQSLTGHSHFISDLALTNDNNHLLSASWDRSLRLWDLRNGKTTKRFVEDGHSKEVLSCAISQDGRFILSSGADRDIKLWNVKAECKHTVKEHNHSDWVTKVRFIPTSSKTTGGQYFASVGWDGYLKIWNNQTFNIKDSVPVHDGSINAITVSPRGNFIVTGGKDKKVRVFDFSDIEKLNLSHDAGSPVNCLAFNPRCHWIAIGTEVGWQIWDFEAKDSPVIGEGNFKLEGKKNLDEKPGKKRQNVDKFHQVTSIAWNTLGNRLFVGYSSGDIKVVEVTEEKNA